jgi:hypothetical protein
MISRKTKPQKSSAPFRPFLNNQAKIFPLIFPGRFVICDRYFCPLATLVQMAINLVTIEMIEICHQLCYFKSSKINTATVDTSAIIEKNNLKPYNKEKERILGFTSW